MLQIRKTPAQRFFSFRINKLALIVVSLIVTAAFFAPWLAPADPLDGNLRARLQASSIQHFLGTDDLGRDVLSRLIYGSRVSLIVAFFSVGISMWIGVFLGALAGFFGGWIDELIMRFTDIMLAFPGILLAIALMAVLGPGLGNVVLALSLVGWKGFARLVRGEFLREANLEYVHAARALGISEWRIMFRHIFPNVAGPVAVTASLSMAGMILSEASLSFLGLGTQPPTPSWGAMLAEGRNYIFIAAHLCTWPGLAIMAIVLAFNFVGEGLRDALDPKHAL